MPQKSVQITITIESKKRGIPTQSLTTFLNNFTGILHSAARQLAPGKTHHIDWEITGASMNSPFTFTLEAMCANPRLPRRVVRGTVSGLKILERRAVLPEYMADQDLSSAVSMVSVLNDGIKSIKISSEEFGEVRPTQHITANVQEIRQSYRRRFMSFRGYLEAINTHGKKHEFEIFDVITDQRIRCVFEENRYQEVGHLLNRRVAVYGEARLSKSDVPQYIIVSDFRGLPNAEDVPSILEMAPLEIPGGLDAVEYVRRIRNGENL